MILLKLFLFGVILPALVAGVILLLAWRPWRRDAQIADGAWSGGLAIGVGYIVGHTGLVGWRLFLPVEATQWLVYIAIAASAVSLLNGFWQAPPFVRWGLRLMLSGLTLWLLLRPMVKNNWGPLEDIVWLTGLGIAMLIFWGGLAPLADRLPSGFIPLMLLIVVTGASIVLLLSGSLLLSQLAGALAAALGVSLIVVLLWPNILLSRSILPVVTVLFAGLLLSGYFYVEIPAVSALLLAVAPLAAWMGHIAPVRRLKPWQVTFVRLAAVFIPVALAVAFALGVSPPDSYGY